ncbi:hypothetical protein GJ496_008794 [Pomphorhynchus laevis]|nr:hypothetical protein GJ496_008794 [Pomphorhynchus laevis]
MSCHQAHNLVSHVVDTASRMVDFTIAILGVVGVRKKLLMHNEAICIDLEDVTMIPECNFRFSLSFDVALFRKMLRAACQRSKRAINELRICRLRRPYDVIQVQPILTEKFINLTLKIKELQQRIEDEIVIERKELREFKEITLMFAQLKTDVNLLMCNLANSIRLKDTVLFAAPVTDIMGVLSTILVKLECLAKRLAIEMQEPIIPPRCKQEGKDSNEKLPLEIIKEAENELHASQQNDTQTFEDTMTELSFANEASSADKALENIRGNTVIAPRESKRKSIDILRKSRKSLQTNTDKTVEQINAVNSNRIKKRDTLVNIRSISSYSTNVDSSESKSSKRCAISDDTRFGSTTTDSTKSNGSTYRENTRSNRLKVPTKRHQREHFQTLKLIQPVKSSKVSSSIQFNDPQIATNQNFPKLLNNSSTLDLTPVGQFSKEYSSITNTFESTQCYKSNGFAQRTDWKDRNYNILRKPLSCIENKLQFKERKDWYDSSVHKYQTSNRNDTIQYEKNSLTADLMKLVNAIKRELP